MASVLLHNHMEGHKVPFLQYVGCLAVVAALQELFAQRLGDAYLASEFPIRIKWPNDIHVKQGDGTSVKLGGILGQTVTGRGAHSTVMGIGLNVSNAEPTTCANSVLSALAQRHDVEVAPLTRGGVLAAVLNHFEVFTKVLEQDGFASLQGTYRRHWLHEGQRLRVHDDTGSEASEVTICGIGENAFLLGRDDEGKVCELHYDSNSLDLMQGMIRRKQ